MRLILRENSALEIKNPEILEARTCWIFPKSIQWDLGHFPSVAFYREYFRHTVLCTCFKYSTIQWVVAFMGSNW